MTQPFSQNISPASTLLSQIEETHLPEYLTCYVSYSINIIVACSPWINPLWLYTQT